MQIMRETQQDIAPQISIELLQISKRGVSIWNVFSSSHTLIHTHTHTQREREREKERENT